MKKVKFLPLLLCVFLTAGLFSGCAVSSAGKGGSDPAGSGSAAPADLSGRHATVASSYEDVYKALNDAVRRQSEAGRTYGPGTSFSTGTAGAAAAPAATPAPAADNGARTEGAAGAAPDYSQTNAQVQGVDEGDIVKTDGTYIYVLRQNELIIFRADGASTARVGSLKVGADNTGSKPVVGGVNIPAGGKTPDSSIYESEYASDIYVSGDTAAVVTSYSSFMPYYAPDAAAGGGAIGSSTAASVPALKTDIAVAPVKDNKQIAKVYIVDLTDRTKPAVKAELGQDGSVLSSRLVGSTLYLISNYYVYNMQEGDSGTYVPRTYAGGSAKAMSPDRIAIMPAISSTAYTVVCSYGLDKASALESQSVLGGGSTVYMNKDTLYIANSTSSQTAGAPYADSVYTVVDYTTTTVTDITSFDLTNGSLKLKSSGSVPGGLQSQFALDEYNGSLRVVTTVSTNSWSEYTDKAKGFVNYVWKDPQTSNALYVLDGALKTVGSVGDLAPGEQVYSVRFDGPVGYVVTFRQVDPLFAVDLSDPARPAVLSALKIPGFSQYLHVWSDGRLFGLGMDADEKSGAASGMKLTMFDTTDKTNVTVKNSLKLDTGWSSALYNHKAILISPEKGLVAFPADSGYDIYSYSDEAGFRKLARVDSVEWSADSRGLYIGDFVYIVDQTSVSVLDMTAFRLLDRISY
jgi:inhibitor of cysteine peptidase